MHRSGLSSIILRLSVFSRHTPFAVGGYVYKEANHNLNISVQILPNYTEQHGSREEMTTKTLKVKSDRFFFSPDNLVITEINDSKETFLFFKKAKKKKN